MCCVIFWLNPCPFAGCRISRLLAGRPNKAHAVFATAVNLGVPGDRYKTVDEITAMAGVERRQRRDERLDVRAGHPDAASRIPEEQLARGFQQDVASERLNVSESIRALPEFRVVEKTLDGLLVGSQNETASALRTSGHSFHRSTPLQTVRARSPGRPSCGLAVCPLRVCQEPQSP